ncbi:MAG: hypothetical protein BWX71_01200 [Deltaproteobacteria bacterium ADurb.Bin072]|nr:MAG: hypothetical protein BWX71_01200 [Deltaproteobacteria bacterium ADurb.Bin072]
MRQDGSHGLKPIHEQGHLVEVLDAGELSVSIEWPFSEETIGQLTHVFRDHGSFEVIEQQSQSALLHVDHIVSEREEGLCIDRVQYRFGGQTLLPHGYTQAEGDHRTGLLHTEPDAPTVVERPAVCHDELVGEVDHFIREALPCLLGGLVEGLEQERSSLGKLVEIHLGEHVEMLGYDRGLPLDNALIQELFRLDMAVDLDGLLRGREPHFHEA